MSDFIKNETKRIMKQLERHRRMIDDTIGIISEYEKRGDLLEVDDALMSLSEQSFRYHMGVYQACRRLGAFIDIEDDE